MNVTRLDKDDVDKPLVNRVAKSGLITLDLEKYKSQQEILELDIKDFLFQELLLKEKEFRQKVEETDWSTYAGKAVAVHCSTDAIIQQWAYMLIVTKLSEHTESIFFGTKEEVTNKQLVNAIQQLPDDDFRDERVIVKGCSKEGLSDEAYVEITKKLLPLVRSLMFGEACSTVPVFKQKKKKNR